MTPNVRARLLATIIILASLLTTLRPNASPLKNPKRMVSVRTVDLTPLFQWWNQKNGDRPLSAWLHVTGEIVGTNAGSWIITAETDGQAEGNAPADKKIVLRNPPLQDRAEFEQMLAQKKTLEAQKASLNAQAEQADAKLKDISQERKVARERHVRASGLNAQSGKLKQEEKTAKAEAKPIQAQIDELDKKLKPYGSTDHYVVDCFALRTTERVGGMPVFDHGAALR
jgi:uncharacterized protein YlxW (UPF0749 family)